jgi:hypothetical protein
LIKQKKYIKISSLNFWSSKPWIRIRTQLKCWIRIHNFAFKVSRSLFFRLKDLRSPAKKWKLEKNAQQLYMTGTVVLYQVFCRAGSGLMPDPDWGRIRIGPGSGLGPDQDWARIRIGAGSGLGQDPDWGRIRIEAGSGLGPDPHFLVYLYTRI